MKTRLILLLAIACTLLACKNEVLVPSTNDPVAKKDAVNPDLNMTKGRILATIGCYKDESTKNNKEKSPYYEGCVIETEDKDTFLTFNFEQDLVPIKYGEKVISVDIPFAFAYTLLSKDDDRYVTFDPPLLNAQEEMFCKPLGELQQAVIYVKDR